MTGGGNKLNYPGNASSPTISVLDAKIHINSTILDAKDGAHHLGLDIHNYYLGTRMEYFQYLRVPTSVIPHKVWDDPHYDIDVADNGWVYLEICRGMHGLKEAGIIAFNQLIKKLAPSGYEPMPFTPGLWWHRTKRTTFVLCVEDFGVKYFSKADDMHLIEAIQADYTISPSSGPSRCTAASLSIGTTMKDTSTYPCQDTSTGHSQNLTTLHPYTNNTPLTNGSSLPTAPANPKLLPQSPRPSPSIKPAPPASKPPSMEPSCIMAVPVTPASCPPSTK
jgi:hypothetical protein